VQSSGSGHGILEFYGVKNTNIDEHAKKRKKITSGGWADEPVKVMHKHAKGIIVFCWKLFDQVCILAGLLDRIRDGGCKDELVVKNISQ
jgi:hypothetical protein